jgi:MFS family permease
LKSPRFVGFSFRIAGRTARSRPMLPQRSDEAAGAPSAAYFRSVERPALLRLRDFRLIFATHGLSSLGDYVALIALTIRVADLTGSGLAVAGLLVAGMLPLVLFAPWTGMLVDRIETVRLLVVSSAAQAVVAVALAFTSSYPLILLLFFLLGAGFAINQTALFALVPRAVGEERTTPANAALELARWGGSSVGPLVGGGLAAAAGTRIALLADAGTFLLMTGAMIALRIRRRPGHGESEDGERPRARDGFAFVTRRPLLRLVFAILTASVLFAAIDNVAEVFFAKGVLRAGDLGYGALVASWTVGMVVALSTIGRRLPPERLGIAVILGALTVGLVVGVAASFPVLPLALLMFFLGGGANGIENVAMRSMIHRRVPDRLRGRVFAAYYGLVHGAQILALGAGGLLVGWVGARGSLLVAGAGGVVVGLIGLVLYPRARADRVVTRDRAPAPPGPRTRPA